MTAERFEPASECSWVIEPRPIGRGNWSLSVSGARGGIACDVMKTRREGLAIHLAYRSRTLVRPMQGEIASEYRPAVFDARRDRIAIVGPSWCYWSTGPDNAGESSDTAFLRFEMMPEPQKAPSPDQTSAADIAFIGVERLSPDALQAARLQAFLKSMTGNKLAVMDLDDRKNRSGLILHRDEVSLYGYPANSLGLLEILRNHRGEIRTTPDKLREARTQAFVGFMKERETEWGARFANWFDPVWLYGYELIREQRGEAPKGRSPTSLPKPIVGSEPD